MNKAEYKRMSDLEKVYWWHQGRLHLVDELLKKYKKGTGKCRILEVGCGTGVTTKHLEKYGDVMGIDISEDAIKYGKEFGVKNIHLLDINDLPSSGLIGKDDKFDLIFALDVLEHIQDDVKAMKVINNLLTNDGVFISTVPAHKFLWSEHDESLHHKRRYHYYELSRKMIDSGLEIKKMTYFIFTFFPIILFYRIWTNIVGRSAYPKTSYVLLPDWLNNHFINLLRLESKWIKNFTLPIGVTLVTVAQKNSKIK